MKPLASSLFRALTDAELLLSQLLDVIFIEFALLDNFQDEVALLVGTVPPLFLRWMAVAVAVTATAMAISVRRLGQKARVLDVAVHVGLQRGKEMSALIFNLAYVANLLADGKRIPADEYPGSPSFLENRPQAQSY